MSHSLHPPCSRSGRAPDCGSADPDPWAGDCLEAKDTLDDRFHLATLTCVLRSTEEAIVKL